MKKKTILMLSDHSLSSSGVGTQARWLINGLVNTGKYSFRTFGAAVRHDSYETIVVNPDFIIKPIDGFGNRELLRTTLAQVKPDALLLFTDPRFFNHVWAMEDEIHQICPIAYWHLWDNPPWPEFNRSFYEATDLINCINYPTYEMVRERFPEKTNYIPHAVPADLYAPLSREESLNFKIKLLGREKADHFTVLYVSRNARRKMTSDILVSWRDFIESLRTNHGHTKATLILHTDPMDPEGTNLLQVIDLLGIRDHVVFSKDRIGFNEMRSLYCVCDTIVNRSCNEGFGLPTLEAMMCGKPIIAIKTGGLTRQVEHPQTGEQFGIGMDPEVRTMVGNHMVPYIYEDFVSHKTVTSAFIKMYEMGSDERERIGARAAIRAREDYNLDRVISDWDSSLERTIEKFKNGENKKWKVTTI